ncbi:MAG TPA: arsenate reductase (glutaredoxin) [Acidimicrobiales bacterium]|nr:arsenate reductase (glutaredoxin) [Acidimicrobiales bacterium]
MADVTIYHNPRCSSSRTALGELRSRDVDLEVVEYLKAPLDREALEHLLDVLDAPPADLVRHDARFQELGLDPDGYTTREQVVDVLVEHPELMQRPILVRGGRAVIARPAAEVVASFVGPS